MIAIGFCGYKGLAGYGHVLCSDNCSTIINSFHRYLCVLICCFINKNMKIKCELMFTVALKP